jgi:N-acetylmuramoyl-L-alanine amidase
VPSILVEMGYMSNAAEAKNLLDEEYQNKLTIGIYQGISRYIQEYNETEGFTK